MSNPFIERKGNIYAVDFDSLVGVQIKNYVTRCDSCSKAIRDFLRSLEQKYSFPVHISDHTVYCLSDDCDAGGLVAVSVPKSILDPLNMSERASVLWDAIESPDDDSLLYVFPRVESRTHFIKYGMAVRLFEHGAPEWEFVSPTAKDKAKGMKLHVVTYDEVRNRISLDDRNQLINKPGTNPSPSIRLAVGRKFELNTESMNDEQRSALNISAYFGDAVALYKEWMGLPTVPANTLARSLRLHSVSDSKDLCFCEWRVDHAGHRYLIHTGLTSDLVDMKIVSDPSLYDRFFKHSDAKNE